MFTQQPNNITKCASINILTDGCLYWVNHPVKGLWAERVFIENGTDKVKLQRKIDEGNIYIKGE